MRPLHSAVAALLWLSVVTDAFTPTTFRRSNFGVRQSPVALYAKKKMNAKLAALEALEALEETEASILEEPLSKKEQQELAKKAKKEAVAADEPKMSAKEAALMRALAMEEHDSAQQPQQDDDEPKLSKKELKAQAKTAEKLAAKQAKKKAKKEETDVLQEAPATVEEAVPMPVADANGEAQVRNVVGLVSYSTANIFTN